MRLTLPFPPSANRYWRNYHGRMVRSAEAEAYIAAVGWHCNAAGVQPLTGNVCLIMDFYRPSKRMDLDNMFKILGDALQGFAYENDKQIVEIHAMRHDDKDEPRVEVLIQPVA